MSNVNPRARIEITHSKRGTQSVIKTWSALGWEWLGPKNPLLPKLLEDLASTGRAQIDEGEHGVTYFRALDPLYS